jgi:serine/threonine protein kinase
MVMTIEGDPPGLGCYENKKQRSGAAFSKAFEDFISKCLQKLPKTRPSSEELQQHSFLRHRSRQALLLLLPKISSVDDDAVVAAGLHARSSPNNIAALGEGRSPAVGTSWVFDVESDDSGIPQRGLHSSSSSRPRASPSSGAADVSSSSFHSESVYRISPPQSLDTVPAVAAKGGRGDGCGESINDFLSDFERDSATIKGGARDDTAAAAAAGRAVVCSTMSTGAVASMSSTEDFMSELEDIIR